jgi:hypothetical protein
MLVIAAFVHNAFDVLDWESGKASGEQESATEISSGIYGAVLWELFDAVGSPGVGQPFRVSASNL